MSGKKRSKADTVFDNAVRMLDAARRELDDAAELVSGLRPDELTFEQGQARLRMLWAIDNATHHISTAKGAWFAANPNGMPQRERKTRAVTS